MADLNIIDPTSRFATYEFPMGKDVEPLRRPLRQHPDGIYIDLPNLDYLNDWALSYSAFKTLLSSPPDWHWESPFNIIEDKLRRSTPALRFGEALHCALLEPPEMFPRRFGTPPNAKSHPKALRTLEHIKDRLAQLELRRTGNKDELIDRLLEHDPHAQILDVIVDKWKGLGLTPLDEEDIAKIRLMVALAKRHPALDQAFSGVGLSEVSVFWTEELAPGLTIRQRARFDRLKKRASIDLKSFSNWQGRDFQKALLREAALRMYDLQAAHYDVARRKARDLMAEGKVYLCFPMLIEREEDEGRRLARWTDHTGEVHHQLLQKGEEPETIIIPAPEATLALAQEVLGSEAWKWMWIFYKTDGAPTAQPVVLDRETKAFTRGLEYRERALSQWVHYAGMFGLTQMWIRLDPIWSPTEEDWPFFMGADL